MTELGGGGADWEKLEGPARTFGQMWALFFEPELKERLEKGLIAEDFGVYFGQILFPIDASPIVLFNNEVLGHARIKIDRQIDKVEEVYLKDIDGIEQFDLPDDRIDCGHFTIVWTTGGWKMFFNFLRGRAKALDILDLARQYVDAARYCALNGLQGPSVDNLYSAAELVAKAELIPYHNDMLYTKTHSVVASKINSWSKLGNVDRLFVKLFNRLMDERYPARYGDKAGRPQAPTDEDFGIIEAMITKIETRLRRTTDDDNEKREP